MSKSVLTGTTWYWREGKMAAPFGSDLYGIINKELCLPISGDTAVDSIRTELENHQIKMHIKTIHNAFLNYPEGTKILYAYCPLSTINNTLESQKNLENLQQYILKNGAFIYDNKLDNRRIMPKIDFRSIFKWFSRGK